MKTEENNNVIVSIAIIVTVVIFISVALHGVYAANMSIKNHLNGNIVINDNGTARVIKGAPDHVYVYTGDGSASLYDDAGDKIGHYYIDHIFGTTILYFNNGAVVDSRNIDVRYLG